MELNYSSWVLTREKNSSHCPTVKKLEAKIYTSTLEISSWKVFRKYTNSSAIVEFPKFIKLINLRTANEKSEQGSQNDYLDSLCVSTL